MSRIKEDLIGYERSDWLDDNAHVRVTEAMEYMFYAMNVAEMQQLAKQHIQHDLYNMTKEDFDKMHFELFGRHTA